MSARNILVVGPPRSGTSLTAAAFARHGYFIGDIVKDHVREGDDGNPFGYFEADALVARNVEVLHAAGFPDHNTWKFSDISDEAVRRIGELTPTNEHRAFVESYHRRAPWVWKDPRLCFTLAYWWKLLDPNAAGVVFVRREFPEVYNSFVQRQWCADDPDTRARMERRIARHLAAAQDAIQRLGIPHVAIDYGQFLGDPQQVARQFSDFCGVPFSAAALNVRPELNHSTTRGWLEARLRRSLRSGWLRPLRVLRPLAPSALLGLIFPEKRCKPQP